MSIPVSNTADTIKWTKVEVDALVSVMVEEVKKGNKTTSTFNKSGWKNIKAKLEAQFGRPFTSQQLRNKMNKLRTDYGSFKKLLGTSGFNWNVDIRACEVTDESVWDRHIKENPTWLKFKRNGLPQWPELQIIFGDSYASGSGAVSSSEDHNVLDQLLDEETDIGTNILSLEIGTSDPEHNSEGTSAHRLDRTPSGKRKKGRTNELVGTLKEMCKVSRARLEFLSTGSTSTSSVSAEKDFSVQNCVAILEEMVDLDKDLYTKAVMKAIENPTWREAFVAVPAERRMWLLEKLD